MMRIPFSHADEISLRLSDTADDDRVRRLATSDAAARVDSLIKDMEYSQREIIAALRRKIARRAMGPLHHP
jgi:hypothetical protein